jgi:serine/threonine protein kinase
LDKSLSRGGMGEVYLAVAKGPNKWCVIKTIRGDLTGDDEFIGRFADEAKIMVRISHDNIIRVFDAGKVEHDYYIAMEYMHGRDLGDVLDRAYERGEPLPAQIGLYVSSHVLRGLDYAHNLTDEQGRHMGLVHRDISPQNILIGFDGSIKIIDFGLARTDLLPARTQGALAVGKYGYMSPEQARHEKIDGRADIYSTGVMLFEVFTGDRLVDEQDQATLWQRVLNPKHRNPRSVVPSLPKEIDDLIMTAVAIETRDRYSDAQAMLRVVDGMRTQESNRDALIKYLRYLYPKVDFGAPEVPDYRNEISDGTDRSIIIATSREGAMSVFGRGDLAIEGTTQIDAEELRKAFRRREEKHNFEATTDGSRTAPEAPARGNGIEPPSARMTDDQLDPPTQISQLPEVKLSAPKVTDRDDSEGDLLDDDQTIQAAPVHGLPGFVQYRDDEMTVMMDAPPRPERDIMDEDTGNAPTRLQRVPRESPPQPSIQKGRAIRERITAQDPSDRTREPPPAPVQERPLRKEPVVMLRGTVPTEAPKVISVAEPTYPPAGAAEMTQPEQEPESKGGILFPAMILLGMVVLILVLAWFVLQL